MRLRKLQKSVVASLLAGTLLSGTATFAPSGARAQSLAELRAAHKAAYDARVAPLLKRMADAYAALTELDQMTEFYVLQTPLTQGTEGEKRGQRDKEHGEEVGAATSSASEGTLSRVPVEKPLGRTVRLRLAAPNLLRMEMSETATETEAAKHATSVCDGKIFWTYNPEKNWYTQEKAPKHLRDFQKIALPNTTLELMMLIGLNPFSDIENQFDAARYEGVENVAGVPVEVVLLRVASDQQTQELRFYIGQNDSLLRRLVIESTPSLRVIAPPKHDPLDDLVARPIRPVPLPANAEGSGDPSLTVAPGFEDPHPVAPPGTPTKTRITCDNVLTITPRFEDGSFHFAPPQGASLYQSVNGNNELSKLSSKVTINDLLKQANPGRKIKKSKPVRIGF